MSYSEEKENKRIEVVRQDSPFVNEHGVNKNKLVLKNP